MARICTKDHVSESFGQVPKGSLWDDDADVVAENPKNFKADKATDDDEVE
jgi:hypothetical protein